ncbi:MAG: OsmC family protein [Bacteroidales bacterium]|jgi:putative redox protein|nr:OsmC family protein [Bacteroidales bacterium]
MDKSKELTATIKLINDKLNFSGTVEGNTPVSIDYTPPLGDNLGYTSLELLLMSLSSCLGSSVLTFLRRMGKTITGFEIRSHGFRKQEHPTGLSLIIMEMDIRADNLSIAEIDKVIQMSEETYCPVWSMVKGNVTIEVKYNITR